MSEAYLKIEGAIYMYVGIVKLHESDPDNEDLIALRKNIFQLYLETVVVHTDSLSQSDAITLAELATKLLESKGK